MNEMNNIFKYATKELSQDAVICWLLNWYNYPSSDLHGLAIDMIKLLGVTDIEKIQKIVIKQQVYKADIVVALHGKNQLLIIEDKVYSSEHDEQIKKYADYFKELEHQKLADDEIDEPYDIRTIYFKTGFHYDDDQSVTADVKVDSHMFFSVISNQQYRGKSEILDAFIEHLHGIMDYYKTHGDYCKEENLNWHSIAQYNLMRAVFPKEMWNKKNEVYKVKLGSSRGKPWAETKICEDMRHVGSKDIYCIFWRVDSDIEGPYLSLRLYDWFDKQDKSAANRHVELYEKYIQLCEKVISDLDGKINISWNDVKDGYRGNYFESSLLTFHLRGYIENWPEKHDALINDVNSITKALINEIQDK